VTWRKSLRILVTEQLCPVVQRWRYRLLQAKDYRNIDRNFIIERNVNLDGVFPESIHVG
jgi:hypothetical protein